MERCESIVNEIRAIRPDLDATRIKEEAKKHAATSVGAGAFWDALHHYKDLVAQGKPCPWETV